MDSYKTITRAELYIDKLFDKFTLDLISKLLVKIAYTQLNQKEQLNMSKEIRDALAIHLMANPSILEVPIRRCINYKFGIGFSKSYNDTDNEDYRPICKYFIKRYVDFKSTAEQYIKEIDSIIPEHKNRVELTSDRFNDYFNKVGDLLFEKFSATL